MWRWIHHRIVSVQPLNAHKPAYRPLRRVPALGCALGETARRVRVACRKREATVVSHVSWVHRMLYRPRVCGIIETSSSRRGRWTVCFRRLWSAARGQPGGLGGTALRRADAARPARGRVRRRAVPAMLRWVLHPLGDGRRRSQLQLLQLRRRGDSLAPMTAAASAAAPRALRARVCRVADSSPRPSTTSFFVRQIPSRFSTCWRIFLARRMPSSPRRCARHPPRR
mgnify:CR=1 FL=1